MICHAHRTPIQRPTADGLQYSLALTVLVLYCTVSTCTVLVLYCTCTVLYLYCTCTVLVLYCTVLYCTCTVQVLVLYCTVLYLYCTCTVLYLYCTVLYLYCRQPTVLARTHPQLIFTPYYSLSCNTTPLLGSVQHSDSYGAFLAMLTAAILWLYLLSRARRPAPRAP